MNDDDDDDCHHKQAIWSDVIIMIVAIVLENYNLTNTHTLAASIPD